MGEASGKRSSGKKDANLYPGTDPPCSKVSRPRGRTVDFREVQSLGYCVADRKQPHRFHRGRFLRGPGQDPKTARFTRKNTRQMLSASCCKAPAPCDTYLNSSSAMR